MGMRAGARGIREEVGRFFGVLQWYFYRDFH
jgi:hypothetical protein